MASDSHIWTFHIASSKLSEKMNGHEVSCCLWCIAMWCTWHSIPAQSLMLQLLTFWKWNLVTRFPLAENKGVEFGRVEEHPRSTSLGGLEGIPGPAALQTEQIDWRMRRKMNSLHVLQQDAADKTGRTLKVLLNIPEASRQLFGLTLCVCISVLCLWHIQDEKQINNALGARKPLKYIKVDLNNQ